MKTNLDVATEAWGEAMPAWIAALAQECDLSSQRQVAARIRYSAGAISQVLSKKYPTGTDAIEAAFNGAYQGVTVRCPVLGDLPRQICGEHQRQPFSTGNPTRVRMYRACRSGCPHSTIAAKRGQEKS